MHNFVQKSRGSGIVNVVAVCIKGGKSVHPPSILIVNIFFMVPIALIIQSTTSDNSYE